MTTKKMLKLDGLHERHPGLTAALAGTYEEAAAVTFSRYHRSPVKVAVCHSSGEEQRELPFREPDDRTRRAHANEIDATETGAYGVCLAAVEECSGLVAVSRAETLTGADWYVAPNGTPLEDLEACLRLEVSGLGRGTVSEISSRLRKKVKQAADGNSNLPALASVVGFEACTVLISPIGTSE